MTTKEAGQMALLSRDEAGQGRWVGGRYRLGHLLAQGGMGRVYCATQMALSRRVAIKLLQPHGDAEARKYTAERFVWEAAAAARLHHPHSVTVLDYGVDADGTAFLVMEYLQGRTLAQLLREQGRLPLCRALSIAKQAASALMAAHHAQVVHRDLKPANLFLLANQGPWVGADGSDFVKVVDFGLAKQAGAAPWGHLGAHTATGRFLGSPGYMAPEQIRGQTTDGRADVYALGAVLFEMVVGAPCFSGKNAYETMVAHVYEPVPELRLMPGLRAALGHHGAQTDALLQQAMAKDPQDRFASMQAFYDALHQLQLAVMQGFGPKVEAQWHPLARAGQETWTEVRLHQALGPNPSAESAVPLWDAPPLPAQRPGQEAAIRGDMPLGRWVSSTRGRWAGACALVILGVILVSHTLWPKVAEARGPVLAQLHSEPEGAAVFVGAAKVCSATPCVITLSPWRLKRHVSLRFVHPEFDEYVATRRLMGASLEVVARLLPADPGQ